jgi:hypothetical protein
MSPLLLGVLANKWFGGTASEFLRPPPPPAAAAVTVGEVAEEDRLRRGFSPLLPSSLSSLLSSPSSSSSLPKVSQKVCTGKYCDKSAPTC